MKYCSPQFELNNDYGVFPLNTSIFNSKNKKNLIMDSEYKNDFLEYQNNLKSNKQRLIKKNTINNNKANAVIHNDISVL